jgi:hypothetical protein
LEQAKEKVVQEAEKWRYKLLQFPGQLLFFNSQANRSGRRQIARSWSDLLFWGFTRKITSNSEFGSTLSPLLVNPECQMPPPQAHLLAKETTTIVTNGKQDKATEARITQKRAGEEADTL